MKRQFFAMGHPCQFIAIATAIAIAIAIAMELLVLAVSSDLQSLSSTPSMIENLEKRSSPLYLRTFFLREEFSCYMKHLERG